MRDWLREGTEGEVRRERGRTEGREGMVGGGREGEKKKRICVCVRVRVCECVCV